MAVGIYEYITFNNNIHLAFFLYLTLFLKNSYNIIVFLK